MLGSKSLKIRIFVTIGTALCIGMILTNIVVVSLWYTDQVKRQKNLAIQALQLVSSMEGRLDYTSQAQEYVLFSETIRQVLGDACRQILIRVDDSPINYRKGEIFTRNQTSYDSGLQSTVSEALLKNENVVRKLSTDLDFWSLQPTFVAVATVLQLDNQDKIGIGVLLSNEQITSYIWDNQRIVIVYILLNAIILATLVLFRMRKLLLDPLDKLVLQADTYQLSQGTGLFSDYSGNELGQLSRAMKDMVKRIEEDRDRLRDSVVSLEQANSRLRDAQDEIIHAEKLAALGRLSAGLAHEIGNPVAIVQGYLELIGRDDVDGPDRKQFISRGLDELQRIDMLLKQLLEMARSDGDNMEPVALDKVVAKVIDLLQLPLSQNGIGVSLNCSAKNHTLWADKNKLQQILMNFILNSIDAIAEKGGGQGQIEVNITETPNAKEHGQTVDLVLRDNGSGIDEGNLELIFEPFFTTKEPGKGTGLGMAVANRIISSFNGTVNVSSVKGEGTEFVITLPVHVADEKQQIHA